VEKPPKPIKASLLKMRCSACGGNGHMKTNKNCPLYGKDSARGNNPLAEKTVGEICSTSTGDELESIPSGELIAVEGTKLKLSKKLMKKHKSLRLHIPRKALLDRERKPSASDEDKPGTSAAYSYEPPASMASPSASSDTRRGSTVAKRRGTLEEADYLFGPQKSVHRRRADPRVSMSTVLHDIINEVKSVEGAEHLLHPVNAKKVPDYYKVVKSGMDLQQIRKNITENKYELRHQFLADLKQMLDNSRLYNGDNHVITLAARKIFEMASRRLADNEEKLMELEKAINPLLDDNDMVGLSFILTEIVEECKGLPKSVAFHTKVDAKKFPTYYDKIQRRWTNGQWIWALSSRT
jgi:transcription initiation factor TFIID subunit 1